MFSGKINPKHWEKYPGAVKFLCLERASQGTTNCIKTPQALYKLEVYLVFPRAPVSFWVFLSMITLLLFLLSVYNSFTFTFARKNGVIRKFKVQFAAYEKWRLKLGNRLLRSHVVFLVKLQNCNFLGKWVLKLSHELYLWSYLIVSSKTSKLKDSRRTEI